MSRILDRRAAGMLIPLFSVRSGNEWGVGEFPDLPILAKWAKSGGFSVLMTLPLLEPSPGLDSPYSSCSFFALDPLYIHVPLVPEFAELGGVDALSPAERAELDAIRCSPRVIYGPIRALKETILRRCFAHFRDAGSASARADFASFGADQAHWLDSYAVYRALKSAHPQSWRDWPQGLATAEPDAVAQAATNYSDEIEFRRWLQWVAFRQHEAARASLGQIGVALAGDEPFLVADDSADVWARQGVFRFDATVGAPPDAFSADGQEWGLPPYRWDLMAERGYELFRERGAHCARLYDLIRIDHVVGLYRTYHRPIDGSPHFFLPATEPEQRKQGEAVLAAMRSGGAELIAEDLGVIPDFVRASLKALGIPGYRVLRWEKDDEVFREPATWPELSVATSGTHDTESAIEWWNALPEWERRAACKLEALSRLSADRCETYTEEVREALMVAMYESPSRLLLLPYQDALMLADRINTPNTVGPQNWSWRMPWTIEAMERDSIVAGRMSKMRTLAGRSGRT